MLVNSELINDGNGYYTMDFQDLEHKLSDEKTTCFILCNPHNPTGRVWRDEELKKLAEICRRNQVMIIADEIHGDLCRKEVSFHPIAKVCGPEGIVTMTSQNKTFNMAGLGVCNVVIQDEALNQTYKDYVGFIMPNPFTVAASIAAYEEGDQWLKQLRDYLDGTIDWTVDFLKKHMPKVKVARPEGTYFLWMDFREYGLTPKEFHDKIYLDANVILEDGEGFSTQCGYGFQRICLSTRRSLIQEAFHRIAKEFEK